VVPQSTEDYATEDASDSESDFQSDSEDERESRTPTREFTYSPVSGEEFEHRDYEPRDFEPREVRRLRESHRNHRRTFSSSINDEEIAESPTRPDHILSHSHPESTDHSSFSDCETDPDSDSVSLSSSLPSSLSSSLSSSPSKRRRQADSTKKPRKRHRTTPEQLEVLERVYEQERLPGLALRKKLAEQLRMTPRRVQVWFQNKRAKDKRVRTGRSESLPSAEVSRSVMQGLTYYNDNWRRTRHASFSAETRITDV